MQVHDPWIPFRKILDAPWDEARSWKERTGGKVIGHLLPDVPEEIIHAAGALPLAIEGGSVHGSRAQAHIPAYTCNHAMGAVEMGLRGDLDVLDGIVIPYTCDTTRNLSHIWARLFPRIPAEFVRLPKRLDFAGARAYLRQEFSRLLTSIAQITGRSPGAAELRQSITLYNISRSLLRRAYEKKIGRAPGWTEQRLHMLLSSALRAPREEHIRWMESLPWDAEPVGEQDGKIPIYARGKIWDPPEIPEMMDRLGLQVVKDEMVTGFRAVEHDVSTDGDPLDALAQQHLAKIPYTVYHEDPRRLVEHFVQRVQASGARGVLFVNPKFCEAAAFDTPDLHKALEAEKIPSLILETSTRGVSLGQIEVRLEAFREMIAGDLP